MKRFLALTLTVVIIISSLCACSSGNNVNISDKALSVAKSAIEVTDNYLDSKIGYDEAKDKLSELKDEMSYVDDKTTEEMAENKDLYISLDLTIVISSITHDDIKNTDDSYKDVLEARNSLAKDAGLATR